MRRRSAFRRRWIGELRSTTDLIEVGGTIGPASPFEP
jgi:hypothetical protein